MKVSVSAYYAFKPKRTNLVEVGLQIQIRALFNQHKQRIGSRTIKALLRQIGFQVGRYKVRSVMRKLGLVCLQRQAFKVTTKRNERHQVQFNLLNQNFQPLFANEVWAGDMVILPFLMDRISRIKCSSMAAYHRWLDEAFHDYRTTTNGWHNPEYHLSC